MTAADSLARLFVRRHSLVVSRRGAAGLQRPLCLGRLPLLIT
jgi:hypothetical protein